MLYKSPWYFFNKQLFSTYAFKTFFFALPLAAVISLVIKSNI